MDAQPAIPMIGELPPDCIIRRLKWLVPLPPPLLPRPQGDHNTAAIRHGHQQAQAQASVNKHGPPRP